MTVDVPVIVEVSAVIVAVTAEVPRVLTVGGDPHDALPFGRLEAASDRTLELALRRIVGERAGIDVGYVEQLYTFGDRARDPTRTERLLSVAYLALVRQGETAGAEHRHWRDLYEFLPWEDWRDGRPAVIDQAVVPALRAWAEGDDPPAERRERADVTFGLAGAPWDGERVLERYELLYEVGLAPEAEPGGAALAAPLGLPMALDHRRIAATALARLRGKLRYRPLVFELLPEAFTLTAAQRVVEALAGVRLHKQNFRRLLEHGGLVEGTGRHQSATGGRPAELFRFRRDVTRERPAPGVGLPELRSAR